MSTDLAPKVATWLEEIDYASKTEKQWRSDAKRAVQIYRGECNAHGKKGETFNILYSNVETKRFNLYSSTPKPDIRRRWTEKNDLAKAVAEVTNRAVVYTLDCVDFDDAMIRAVMDYLLAGRAITRVRYEADVDEEDVSNQKVRFEQVQWDDFRRGPGKNWEEVRWIAYRHRNLTKKDIIDKFGTEVAAKIDFQTNEVGNESGDDTKVEPSTRKTCELWEIWDKEDRKVKWISTSYPDDFLSVDDDPLELKGFFDIPRPIYAVESATSLVPETEFSKYEILARELDTVSQRMNRMAAAIRVRGVYDSTLGEIKKVFEASDNEFIPAENVSQIIEQKGIEAAIWMFPFRELIEARNTLITQRQVLIDQIYEISGISDIVRGATNPHETARAQQIKANFASGRLEKQKAAVQRYARDLIEIAVEIISQNYTRERLAEITGLNYPTRQQKELARMRLPMLQQFMAQQAQQAQQQQPNPRAQQEVQKLQKTLSEPSWEDIEEVLESDLLREYKIDIETDSTIAVDQAKEQESMAAFLNGAGQFIQFAAEGMQTGVLSRAASDEILRQVARRYGFGQKLEEALEMKDPPKPDPEMQKAQMEAQQKQQEHQMEMQSKQMDLQMKQFEAQTARMEAMMEQQQAQTEAMIKRLEASLKIKVLDNKEQYEEEKHEREMEKLDKAELASSD